MPGSNVFKILYVRSVINHDIPSLSADIRKRVKKAIETRLTVDPIGYGKPLQYSLKGNRLLRVENYQVIYTIDVEKHTVIITAISHRKNIYTNA
jgi:mRNA interferase RelE/StbE